MPSTLRFLKTLAIKTTSSASATQHDYTHPLTSVLQRKRYRILLATTVLTSCQLLHGMPARSNPIPSPTQPNPILSTRNVLNGGFEQPAKASNGAGYVVPEGYGNTPPIIWQTTEDTAPYANALEVWRGAQVAQGGLAAGAHSGAQYAEINGSSNASLYQDVCLLPNETINWSLWHGARDANQTNIMTVSITDPTQWRGKTPPATQLYNSDNLTTRYSDGWLLKQGSWVNTGNSIKPLRFAFAAVQGSGGNASRGNFIDDVNLDLSPIIDFLPTNSSQNINLTSTTEGNTTNNYYLSLRVNGTMQSAGTVQIDLTGLSASRSFTLGSVLKGSATAPGLTATKSGNSIILNIPTGIYDPNVVSNYIHIPIDFSNTAIQSNDALTFTLSNATGGGAAIAPNGISLVIPNLSIVSTSCLGTPRTTVSTTLTDEDVDLSITKTDGQTTAAPGSAVSYTVTVTNNGGTGGVGQTLNSINVVDALPANLQGVTFTPSTGSYNSSTGAWTGLTLAPGQSITLTVAGTVNSTATIGSSLTNTARVSLPTGSTLIDGNSANDTATDTDTIRNPANVVLVKRITAVNGDRTKNPNDKTPLNVMVDDALTNDNNANWPNPKTSGISNFLQGVTNAGKVKLGDTLEYTIYFLNAGTGGATGVKICDRITGSQTLLPDAYGTAGSGKDIQLHQGDGNFTTWLSTTTSPLTSATNTGDRAQLMATSSVPSSCHLDMTTGGAADTGTLVIDVTGTGNANQPDWSPLAGTTGPGTANSYGYIRFTTKVNP
jgi:uncharacterized repeat protein (TIGR01451 family)